MYTSADVSVGQWLPGVPIPATWMMGMKRNITQRWLQTRKKSRKNAQRAALMTTSTSTHQAGTLTATEIIKEGTTNQKLLSHHLIDIILCDLFIKMTCFSLCPAI